MQERTTPVLVLELGSRLAITGALLLAATAVLGAPNVRQTMDFFFSPVPTFSAALAASGFLVWVIVGGALAVSLAGVLRAVVSRLETSHRYRLWGPLIMLAGLLIMAAGLIHHYSGTNMTLSGGSVQEARQELAR